ncbi:MAG: twin-arginine translocase subunit TatC, partial [Candidatus Limisoma sp.]
GYFLVFPITLRFLYQYQLSGNITNMLTLDSYMDNFMMLNLVMGLVFELPLLAWVLSLMGMVRRSFFRRFRRHAVVVLLIVAALITPTGDPITLLIVFLPLYLLYEGSALIVKRDEPTD